MAHKFQAKGVRRLANRGVAAVTRGDGLTERAPSWKLCARTRIYKYFSRKVIPIFNRDALKSFRLKLLKNEYFNAKFLSLYISSFVLIIFGIATIIPFYRDNSLAKENDKTFDPNEASSLSLALSSNTISLAINPTALGSFDSSSMTATVSTNNSTGYNLTMSADTTTLTNTSNDNNESINHIIPTLLSDKDNDNNPFTCTAATSSTCNFPSGYYGYKIGTESTDYLPVSTSATPIHNTNSAITDDETDIVLGAKLNASTAAGTYSGVNLTFIATTNLVPYNIQYNAGNITEGESVTNLPSPDTGNVDPSGTTITVSSTTPTRDGYEFVSWCTVMPTTSGDSDVCTNASGTTGVEYTPSATFTLYPTDATNITLYAMWAEAVSLYMQDMDYFSMNELMPNVNDKATLIDRRDDQKYTVAKLADGKWWMTKNLNIAGGTTLTAADTNVTADYVNSFTTSNNLTKVTSPTTGIQLPTSSTSGFNIISSNSNYAFVYNSANSGTISGNTTIAICNSDVPCFSYYSWDAATLGSGRSVSTDNAVVSQSICPKGWKLPTSNAASPYASDFFSLTTAYGMSSSSSSQSTSNFYNQAGPGTTANFLLSGYYLNGNYVGGGSYGDYWSSASYANTSRARDLNFSEGSVASANYYGDRYFGFAVRCLFDDTLYAAIANQNKGDFNMSTLNATLTTSNSGVYKYTGEHSDNNPDGTKGTNDIYFYRGIIDSSFASGTGSSAYGSSGDGTLYPNYVKLTTNDNITCWRIFRTTASGGVKMLYNGLWTGSTCANLATDANAVSDVYYNRGTPSSSSNGYGNEARVTYVGYNYNSTYGYDNTTSSNVATSTLFNNGTASKIRTETEKWYKTIIDTSNNGLFETNAGYCNDRTAYTINSVTPPPATSVVPYQTYSSYGVVFGAKKRLYSNYTASLECLNTTNLDLLDGVIGKSYPVALITADEAVLAGNGYNGREAYSKTSYLTSSAFWTLSPADRSNYGSIHVFLVNGTGTTGVNDAYEALGLRPAVSLTPHTTIIAGSGTAADPWIVQKPSLTINFDSGVISVAVKSGSATGSIVANITASGTKVDDLDLSVDYYLVPTYKDAYVLDNWTNASSSNASLSCSVDDTCDTTEAPSVSLSADVNAITLNSRSLSVSSIQDFTLSQCRTQATDNDVYVTDIRDDKIYTVRYINDACWMTQNLAYTGISSDAYGRMTLNTTTSNIDTNKTLSYNNLTSGNSYTEARLHVPNINDDSAALDLYTTSQLGAWYNYVAATGGTISGDSNPYTATYDICPKGWHLPSRNTAPGAVSSIENNLSAFNHLYGGFYDGGSLGYSTNNGYWWTNAAFNGSYRYSMYRGGDKFTTGTSNHYYGFYVRCVRTTNPTIADATYMQDVTQGMVESSPIETTYTLKDGRDNQEYTVAKLKDGKLWMTKNLNLAGGAVLNSANSNVSDTYIANMGTVSGLTVNTTNKTITLPSSSTTGFSDNNTAYVYNSACTSNSSYCGYYSWTAATLGGKNENGVAISTDGQDATASICPKGWKLPASGKTGDSSSTSTIGYKKGDFYGLLTAYGENLEASSYSNTGNFWSGAGAGTTANFLLGGRYLRNGTNNEAGDYGEYWSTSWSDSTSAYGLNFHESHASAATDNYRQQGWSVRCLFAG
ncbi:hypothetical protein IJ135_01205 [Candidatus Saccharibacteria bacterium]|nr:hypothetical protein [Candidatus Saccharibacteria bacterium]